MQTRKNASLAITALLISAAILTVFTYTQTAQASDPVLYVGTTTISALDSSCSHPGYNTVQAAINAAPRGSTIEVCPGTYTEQDVITKSLTITAAIPSSPPTILAPSTLQEDPLCSTYSCSYAGRIITDIIDISGSVTVTMSHLIISGPSTTLIFGIFVYGGANLILESSTITQIQWTPTNGGAPDSGLEVGWSYADGAPAGEPSIDQVGTATLTNVNINNYGKNGITVDGAGSMLAMSNSVVTGEGPQSMIAQNGIQVSDSANSNIMTTTISGDEWTGYCPPLGSYSNADYCAGPNVEFEEQSPGILLYDPGTSTIIEGNTITACDVDIYAYLTNGLTNPIASNTLSSPTYYGVVLQDSSLTLSNNRFTGGLYGVAVVADSQNVVATLHGNTFSGQSQGSFFTWEGTVTYPPWITVSSVTTTLDSTTVTVASGGFPGVVDGMIVSEEPEIPLGTTVTSVSGNTLTLSQEATASGTFTLTFQVLPFSTGQSWEGTPYYASVVLT